MRLNHPFLPRIKRLLFFVWKCPDYIMDGIAHNNLTITTENWVELSGHGIGYLGSQEVVGGFTKYWMFSNTLIEGVKWLGAVQNDWTNWNNTSNWTSGRIPTCADALIIPNTTYAPPSPHPEHLQNPSKLNPAPP